MQKSQKHEKGKTGVTEGKKLKERMEGIGGHPRKEKRVTFTSLLPNPSKQKAVHFLKRAKRVFPLQNPFVFKQKGNKKKELVIHELRDTDEFKSKFSALK